MTERKIVAIGHSSAVSGAERVLIRYIDALQPVHDGGICVICPEGQLTQALKERDVEVVVIPELALPAGHRAVAGVQLAARWVTAARTIRQATSETDALLINGLMALPSVRLAGRSGQSVWLVHDVVVRSDRRLVGRLGSQGLRAAVAVSQAAAAFPRRIEVETTVVANGTPWPVEPATGPATDARPVVGINASLTRWKGQHVLLQAMAELPDVDVEIMGSGFAKDGPYIDELRALADSPDLAGRVRFLGQVDDPLAVMRRWTLAVSASIEPEAASLAVMEAMSLGLPVVVSNHGGAPEVLGGTGLVYEPDDVEGLRGAVARIVSDQDLGRRLGAKARQRVSDYLSQSQAEALFVDEFARLQSLAGWP